MRLIVDNLSDGHKDIFLKIDVMPSKLMVADSYYLHDFFGLPQANVKQLAVVLLEFWKNGLNDIGTSIFLPFDLSDQYIGGFCVKKNKIGYVFSEVYTEKIKGYNVSHSTLDAQIENVEFENENGSTFLISEISLLQGLNYSIKELRAKHPI